MAVLNALVRRAVHEMREIFTVIKGNFRKNKASYISIAVLMFLVSISLTGVFSIAENTGKRDEQAMEDTGYGHILAAMKYQGAEQTYEEYEDFCNEIASDMTELQEVDRVDTIKCIFLMCMI